MVASRRIALDHECTWFKIVVLEGNEHLSIEEVKSQLSDRLRSRLEAYDAAYDKMWEAFFKKETSLETAFESLDEERYGWSRWGHVLEYLTK